MVPSDEQILQLTSNIGYFKPWSLNQEINLGQGINWLENRKTNRFFIRLQSL